MRLLKNKNFFTQEIVSQLYLQSRRYNSHFFSYLQLPKNYRETSRGK